MTGSRPGFVSVVIPVRDGVRTIGDQLAALARQEYDGTWELVVADNRSTDGTRAVVEQHRSELPALTVVSAVDGTGINYARNAAIKAARGEYVLVCDADDVVCPKWIEAHVDRLATADLSGGPVDEETLNSPAVAEFNRGRDPTHAPVCGGFLPYAIGCNMGFRRRVWEAIGGFDERWERGGTEIEFCWRAQLAGFSLGWAPTAWVQYRHEPSLVSEARRRYVSAKAVTRLFADYRAEGMQRTSAKRALLTWAWVLFRLPWALVSRSWRSNWLQVAAWRSGLLAGSLRYRVRYL